MSDSPLINLNLGELAKPATVLIQKVSNAIGGIFEPYQIIRVAKAEAEADLIRAEAKIRVTDVHRRAMHRFLQEEAKKQLNIESITQLALPHLEENSSPDRVEDDWITNFFDKCRIVSDAEMQRLWARVLASEANVPGRFSRKTINLIADLNKSDAELFTQVCRFGWTMERTLPLVFSEMYDIYERNGLNFDSLSHLQTLGLILYGQSGFMETDLPNRFRVFYFGKPMELATPGHLFNRFEVGNVLLTKAGQELAPLCGATPIDGFYEIMSDHWRRQGLIPKGAEAEPKEAAEGEAEG